MTNPTKPTMTAPKYETIPQQMKDIPHWVNWKYFWIEDKQRWTKLPLNPIGLKAAKSDDLATWGQFTSVTGNTWNRPDIGIGFEIGSKAAGHSSGLFCVDLDHVLKDGTIQDPAALDIFETLDSYTEISPGGDGLHIWIKADVTEERAKRKGVIEMYGDGRYITVTGNIYGTRTTIEERTAEINDLIDRYLTAPAAADHARPSSVATETDSEKQTRLMKEAAAPYDPWDIAGMEPAEAWNGQTDTDADILQKMEQRQPGAAALYRGDMSAYRNDHSAADQALVNVLAYWGNYDPVTVDRLFRQSALMRDKWDKVHDPAHNRTYGQMTIDKAIGGRAPRTPNAAPKQQPAAPSSSSSVATGQQTGQTPGPQPSQSGTNQQTQGNQGAATQQTPPQIEDVHAYSAAQLRTDFEDMILIKTPRISTGFVYLNQLLDGGLYPSLITLGAITSTGKTTLGLQIMDNIAAAGKDVIIFSLEMSRFELIAKSISRLSFKDAVDKRDAFTTRQLLDYDSYQQYTTDRLLLIERSKRKYFDEIAPHVFIRQSPIGGMGIDEIQKAMQAHADQTGTAPVVLVDYIQLMTPPANNRRSLTDKQVIDLNVMSLKQLSRTYNTPVIGISSVNRAAYSYQAKQSGKTKIDLTDFKESGAIEFSSDILLGLNQDSYDDKTKVGKMSLDILKNRNGAKGTTQNFDYYYPYNCFVENNLTATAAPKVI